MRILNLKDQLIFWMVAIAVVLLPNSALFAQQLKVSSKFDSTTIQIGDQIRLHFDVDLPLNAKVIFPSFKDTITSKIEVIKTFPPDSLKKDGKLHIRQDILVTSFDSGYHSIPPLTFAFEIGQSKDTLRTIPLYLMVNSLPVDTTKGIKDIKPPFGVPFSILDYWQYIVGFFGLVFIVFAIWFIIKLRKKEPLFGSIKPIDPPHIIALRELDILRAEKLWQHEKTKQYYTRLTEIIRTYIENRFEIDALEMTSEEIVEALKNTNLDDYNHIELLHKMFQTADLVKFAKGQPFPDENEVNMLNAYQFVNNTKVIVPILSVNAAEDENTEMAHVNNSDVQLNSSQSLSSKKELNKPFLLKGFLFLKRIKVTYRLGIILIAFCLFVIEGLPDTIFNLRQKNAPSLSIAELKKMSEYEIPRYLSIKDATVPGDSYIEVTREKNGIKRLSHIYYPVYPLNKAENESAYIIIKDSRVTKDELEKKTYFIFTAFKKIEGMFDGGRLSSQDKKLIEDSGLPVASNAIIIERDKKPWSLLVSFIVSLVCVFLILVLVMSLFSQRLITSLLRLKN